MKKLSVIICIIVMAILMTACGGSNTPKAVAEKAVECLKSGDYKGYVDLIYIDEKENTSKEEIENSKQMLEAMLKDKAMKSQKDNKAISSYEVTDEEISEDGENAKVKVSVTYENGEKEDETVKLKKDESGEWKICMGK